MINYDEKTSGKSTWKAFLNKVITRNFTIEDIEESFDIDGGTWYCQSEDFRELTPEELYEFSKDKEKINWEIDPESETNPYVEFKVEYNGKIYITGPNKEYESEDFENWVKQIA